MAAEVPGVAAAHAGPAREAGPEQPVGQAGHGRQLRDGHVQQGREQPEHQGDVRPQEDTQPRRDDRPVNLQEVFHVALQDGDARAGRAARTARAPWLQPRHAAAGAAVPARVQPRHVAARAAVSAWRIPAELSAVPGGTRTWHAAARVCTVRRAGAAAGATTRICTVRRARAVPRGWAAERAQPFARQEAAQGHCAAGLPAPTEAPQMSPQLEVGVGRWPVQGARLQTRMLKQEMPVL
mmetsp:Transcript_14183/g.36222  ORF Transcript_14183/g.36222 Transcript_14183/m.36222 type:complete len:238 (+) Transcript_14183:1735-2448(+)